MAKEFCIPKHLVKKLKESALQGKVDIEKLYGMTSKERREFFTEQTNKELGQFINTEFEKAIQSTQKDALTKWAESVFRPKVKKTAVYKTVLDKIENLDEIGVLSPAEEKAFLEDLVMDKLGINVKPEEIVEIQKKALKIDEAQKALGDDLGSPLKVKENVEFFKAKKEMDDYLQSLSPAGSLRILTGTIGRGMMLASVKSPLLNIGSNIEVGLTEALSRRIANGSLKVADKDLAKQYRQMARQIYKETGYDISRMQNIRDMGASGERILGDTIHAQGKGKTRAVGRVVEDVVFRQLMGAPDAAFGARHFADSVNLNSVQMAKDSGKTGKEIMEDAMRLEPQTLEGELVRAQGILDAQVATWTNKTWASETSEGIRGIINKVSGDLRLGDYLLPFVKTPANVISTGLDYGGLGVFKGLYKTVQGIRKGTIGERETVQEIMRDLTRSGIGLTGAVVITAQLDDADYVGAYDPARDQIEKLRNSNYNAVRIGGKWISTDWFGPLSVPINGIMQARKYGNSPAEKAFQYGVGMKNSALGIPGIADAYDYVKKTAYKKDQSLQEMLGATGDYVITEASSRLIPSIVSDVAKAFDSKQRETGTATAALKAKIPGLRNTLPVKTNVLGEELQDEGFFTNILFGSRVKTDKETPAIKEIMRVGEAADKSINFTDWDKTSSKQITQFKEVKGDKAFKEAKKEYGQELKKKIEWTMDTNKYKKASDEDKLKQINTLDAEARDKTFRKYNFKYKESK